MSRNAIPSLAHTLKVLAYLLRYPDAQLRAALAEMRAALTQEAALSTSRQRELHLLMHQLERSDAMTIEADYVELFDRGRATALHLFEHVHGDGRDRGPAMIDLIQTYEQAGLYLKPGELPDYLPIVLEFASTQPARQAQAFLAETTTILQTIFKALLKRQSPYASVLAAVLEIAGERVDPVAVPSTLLAGGVDEREVHAQEDQLDQEWAEPEVFGGCSTAGQATPNTPQPIRVYSKRPQPGDRL